MNILCKIVNCKNENKPPVIYLIAVKLFSKYPHLLTILQNQVILKVRK